MKKSKYTDYTKSKYFSGEEKDLQEEIDTIKKQNKNIVWVQEFSKKVVVITFALYIIGEIVMLGLLWYSFKNGLGVGIDTFYSELNQTFREVIGGYIVKSAVENSFKIAGNYFVGISNAKLKILEDKLRKDGLITDPGDIETGENPDFEVDEEG